jgi:hypothetical protein
LTDFEVDLNALKKAGPSVSANPVLPVSSNGSNTANRKIRLESKEAKRKRVAEEEAKQQAREEEIESLCKLLTTVGTSLDTNKARAHMDVYFSWMKELTRGDNVSSGMQFMLQVCISIMLRRFICLYDPRRILLSSVIANGSHVIWLQLHQRSPKFTK